MAKYTITAEMLPEGRQVQVLDASGRVVCTATSPGEIIMGEGATLRTVPIPVIVPPSAAEVAMDALAASDRDMPRVAEDLVTALVAKGALKLTDLPAAAQDKLAQRAALRQRMQG